jgi:hypothetical protein
MKKFMVLALVLLAALPINGMAGWGDACQGHKVTIDSVREGRNIKYWCYECVDGEYQSPPTSADKTYVSEVDITYWHYGIGNCFETTIENPDWCPDKVGENVKEGIYCYEYEGNVVAALCEPSVTSHVANVHVVGSMEDCGDVESCCPAMYKDGELNVYEFVWPNGTGPTETTPSEICDNEIDDDGDGLIDCEDGECTNKPACHTAPMISSPAVVGQEATFSISNCEFGILIAKMKYENNPKDVYVRVIKNESPDFSRKEMEDSGTIFTSAICLKPRITYTKKAFSISAA